MSHQKEEIEIEIDHTGKVKLHIIGIKGKTCVQKAQEIAQLIGRIEDMNFTTEYYQPGPSTSITERNRTKI